MIHLKVDWLDAGGLPVYDVDGVDGAYFLDEHQRWNQVNLYQRRRLIIPLGGIDCLLTDFEARLPFWIAELLTLGGEDGTIFFPIRTFGQLNWYGNEEMHWFVIAGLAYIPHLAAGTPLGDENPAQAILRALRDDPTSQAAQDARQVQNLRELANGIQRLEANERAGRLLCEFLDTEQRAEMEAEKRFHVIGADGHRYQIQVRSAHNVFRVDAEGKQLIEYCLVTKGMLPLGDQLLAQKVLLETDPALFHEKANAWALEDGNRVWLGDPRQPMRFRDLIGDGLEIALWRPDVIPDR